jgi:tRNA-2-methylthio-N6-dimethylallyladenosine synthase
MNVLDSQRIYSSFIRMGFYPSESLKEADVFALNTCSVRKKAEEKVWSRLNEVKKLKEKGSLKKIILCGCIPESYGEEILKKFPFIDFLIGPDQIQNIPKILEKEKAIALDFEEKFSFAEDDFERSTEVMPSVSVMEGCNQFCSYCVVPYTRGRERSRNFYEILKEVNFLVQKGFTSIMLLGQVINNYKCPETGFKLDKLLKEIAKIKELRNIIFITSHPHYFGDELIETISEYENISPYIHLPAQSGSNKILKAMNRKYTVEEYINLIEKIKKAKEGAVFSSDFIVGFPSEEEEDFQETINLIKKIRYSSIYGFAYSPRQKTKALELKDNISRKEKLERLNYLFKVQDEIQKENNSKLIGKIFEVQVFGRAQKPENAFSGRDKCLRVVNFKSNRELKKGEWVQVEIEDGLTHSLFGKELE